MNMTVGDNEHRADLRIIGNSNSNGGIFDNVKILGDAKIDGDIDCSTFRGTGNLDVEGSLRAESLKSTGEIRTTEDLQGGSLTITGNLRIGRDLSAAKTNFIGDVEVGNRISGEEISIFGNCTVRHDVQAEYFRVKGALQVNGMLNAGKIEVDLYGRSAVAEIVGGEIKIEPSTVQKWVSLFTFKGLPQLETEVIEGDRLYLVNTIARVVRGSTVIIGKGCQIGLVEYQESLKQDKDAVIEESRYVGL
jgi:cytoskeletal protein CcmA (bactofilin family)